MAFGLDVTKFAEKAKMSVDKTLRGTAIKLFSAVIKSSPVDTGRFRANWIAAGVMPSKEVTASKDVTGESSIADMTKFISTSGEQRLFRLGSNTPDYVFTLANNLPYAHVIEYGGYPDPVQFGTWNKKTKSYEIMSDGGFSKQAPQGCVRVNVARFETILEEQARANR